MISNIFLIVLLALILHVLLIAYGDWQDKNFEVKYTDVDYNVFTDAANYVVKGLSPFKRHTYRYTPILAYFMVPNILLHQSFGKLLFSVFNVATGYSMFKVHQIFHPGNSIIPVVSAASWMFNPLAFTVSTRGNADSIMTLLVVSFIYFLLKKRIFLAGCVYGFSIHFKLYPAVYALPVFIHLSFGSQKQFTFRNVVSNIFFPNNDVIKFLLSSVLCFLLPTAISYILYPNEYVEEALLFHINRKDIRHNFSSYFYLLYLTDLSNNHLLALVLFLPQLALLLIIAFKYSYGGNIMFCLFCETYVFVMFNKVCTSQYFLWFLCLLPLIAPYFKMSLTKFVILLLVWISGQAFWLSTAYKLEFLGENVFFDLWLASLLFFSINCFILCQLINCYKFLKPKLN